MSDRGSHLVSWPTQREPNSTSRGMFSPQLELKKDVPLSAPDVLLGVSQSVSVLPEAQGEGRTPICLQSCPTDPHCHGAAFTPCLSDQNSSTPSPTRGRDLMQVLRTLGSSVPGPGSAWGRWSATHALPVHIRSFCRPSIFIPLTDEDGVPER